MTAEDQIDTIEINLAESRRDLTAYRNAFIDRDAATEYRRAPLPTRTALPEPPPPGSRVVAAAGMAHIARVRGPWTLCGIIWSAVLNENLHLTVVDCLGCLDAYTLPMVNR